MAFVHPFDDPDIIAGQGTLGLELLDDVPDLAKVIVPVGGGGLASGVAIALKSARPDVEVVGVQVETVAAFPASLRAGAPVAVDAALTIADGIAVKRPGELTLPLVRALARRRRRRARGRRRRGDGRCCMEQAKLVVEGAGAVGVAALLGGQSPAAAQRHDRASCSAAATSTPACSRPSRAATRPRPGGGSSCSPACPDRPGSLAAAARARRRERREPRRRRAPPRGRRPPRARDRGAAVDGDARRATTPTRSSARSQRGRLDVMGDGGQSAERSCGGALLRRHVRRASPPSTRNVDAVT